MRNNTAGRGHEPKYERDMENGKEINAQVFFLEYGVLWSLAVGVSSAEIIQQDRARVGVSKARLAA